MMFIGKKLSSSQDQQKNLFSTDAKLDISIINKIDPA